MCLCTMQHTQTHKGKVREIKSFRHRIKMTQNKRDERQQQQQQKRGINKHKLDHRLYSHFRFHRYAFRVIKLHSYTLMLAYIRFRCEMPVHGNVSYIESVVHLSLSRSLSPNLSTSLYLSHLSRNPFVVQKQTQ